MRGVVPRSATRVAFVIGVVCAALPLPVFAQASASVRGKVVAAADQSALDGVHVVAKSPLLPAPVGVDTNAAGEFVLRMLTPGAYTLVVQASGFAPQEVALELEPREVRTVTLRLEIEHVETSVEVTAPVEIVSGTHSPSSTLVSSARLDALPLAVRGTLSEAMASSAPGMIKGHDDFVHVRGEELALNPSIDGVTFWENPHAVFSAALSPGVIQSANVMTGGFSAEYGNRFGGVLDIVTKSGWSMQGRGEATVGGGAAGRGSISTGYGDHGDRTAYYVFGSWQRSARFLSPPEPAAIHDTGTTGHGFAQLDLTLDRNDSLQVIVMGDGAGFEIPKTGLEATVRHADASQRNVQQTAIATWRHAAPGGSVVSTSLYQRWSQANLAPAVDPLAAYARYDRSLLTIGVKSDYERIAGRHSLKGGADLVFLGPDESLEYRYGGFRALSHLLGLPHQHLGDVAFDGHESGGAAGAFIQDAIAVSDRLTMDVGVRADAYRLVTRATHFSPRVNVAYTLADSPTVVHASYNHLFAPPPMEGLLVSSAGLTTTIKEIGYALPPLDATIGNQFETGVSRPVGGILRVSLTGYFRASDHPVHTVVWPDARIYSYATFDRARSYGLEAKAEVPPQPGRRVSGFVNYALGRAWFYGPVVGGFVPDPHELEETGRFLAPMDQTHTVTAGLTMSHAPSRTRLTLGMLYGSGTPVHHHDDHEAAGGAAVTTADAMAPERVPGYYTANVTFGIALLPKRLELETSVENVANRVYALSAESVFSPSQYGIPRLWSVALRWTF